MSRKLFLAVAAAAGVLGALACSDKTEMNTSPDYVRGGTGFTCNFTTTKADARDYLPSAVQTAAQAALRAMSDAYNPTPALNGQATTLGFDFIRDFIVAAHDASTAVGTATLGSKLTNDLFACMNVGMTEAGDFAAALGAKGGYQVRGGTGDPTTPVVSLPLKAGLMPPSTTDYATWVGQRVLFYGAPKSNSFIVNETPVKTVGFSWSTIPVDHSFTAPGLVGLCVNSTDRDRVQEVNGTSGKILPLETSFSALGLDCSSALTVATRSGVLDRLAQFAASVLLPEPAYAAASGGGTGGTVNGLSDFGVVDVSSVSLTMDRIKDAKTTTAIDTFRVVAKTGNGSLLPSVVVTIAVVGNSGSFNVTPAEPTATTDANGVATFTGINIDKAGGYTVTASATSAGITGTAANVTSNLFHIKQ